MKVFKADEKGKALCHRDGAVTTTFAYRDVPFRDGRGIAPKILVGVCDTCGDAIVIPAQSTPAISAARQRAEHSVEVNVPAFYLEVLDAAATRVLTGATTDFRKPLLVYYMDRYSRGAEKTSELTALHKAMSKHVLGVKTPNRRLSMKFTDAAHIRFEQIVSETKLSKTNLIKSLVAKIDEDIVKPEKPKHFDELVTIANVLYA